MINSTSMDNLLPYITESIKNGGQFVFYPKGTSMLPTIIPEKDCVVLIEPFNLKKYDIILFTRESGTFVLHRIIGYKNGKYIINGDNQNWTEETTVERIIAKVDEIRKPDGKIISASKFTSKKFVFKLFVSKFMRRAVNKIRRIIKGEK